MLTGVEIQGEVLRVSGSDGDGCGVTQVRVVGESLVVLTPFWYGGAEPQFFERREDKAGVVFFEGGVDGTEEGLFIDAAVVQCEAGS